MYFGIALWAALLLQPYGVPIDSKESCHVASTGSPDRYIFVKIQEVSTGKVVLQSSLRGGQSRGVFVGSRQIRIEHKWAGDKDYHSAVVAECDKGNTISISPSKAKESALGVK